MQVTEAVHVFDKLLPLLAFSNAAMAHMNATQCTWGTGTYTELH